ncbi:MAG: hypothetical protein ABJZ55_14460 [Fuerstiella sp.]
MKTTSGHKTVLFSIAAAMLCGSLFTGCQTSIGGQTLPSAGYLNDDVQYYPAGPENKLANQMEAARKYRLEQEQLKSGGL